MTAYFLVKIKKALKIKTFFISIGGGDSLKRNNLKPK
tara:strand:- start:648 stop:758 length:111 start_codon:yes stop_codon:yes gene_type:complete